VALKDTSIEQKLYIKRERFPTKIRADLACSQRNRTPCQVSLAIHVPHIIAANYACRLSLDPLIGRTP
jgi:hypothetical protein